MKKLLIVVAILIVAASPIDAYADGWMDLFADSTHSSWCVYAEPGIPYIPFSVYLFVRPPADGMIGYMVTLIIPDPNITYGVTLHPDVSSPVGDWETGKSVPFWHCQTDPWILCATFQMVTYPEGLQPGCQLIELAPHWAKDNILIATCPENYPTVPVQHQIGVYLNCDPCPDFIATKEKSWGAIKSLYK